MSKLDDLRALREAAFSPARRAVEVAQPPAQKAVVVTEAKGTSPRTRKGAVLYAPRGECAYCDARRAAEVQRLRAYRQRRDERA